MRATVVLVTSVCLVASSVAIAGAHPAQRPDHGLNETAYWMLWSGDTDETNVSATTALSGEGVLAAGTDYPLDVGRSVPERWNRRDLQDIPATGANTSAHPAGVTLANSSYIRDAYVTIASVQPSTRAHLTSAREPHYVGDQGTVLGVLDYRVATEDDGLWGDQSLVVTDHAVTDVRLTVSGDEHDATANTRTPELQFDDLDVPSGQQVTITLEATITATVAAVPDRPGGCSPSSSNTGCDPLPATETTDSITVRDSTTVTAYDLSVSGYRAAFPDGDTGVVVYKDTPWLGYRVGDDTVNGVWRFYAARDEQWDTLTYRTGTNRSHGHSPFHPVQVHAYPIATGPAPSNRTAVSIQDVYGTRVAPPELPDDIALDTVNGTYTASFGIATRLESDTTGRIQARGLVRGVTDRIQRSSLQRVQINETNLTVRIAEERPDTLTVRGRLRDATTGEPITTRRRAGYVVVNGQRVNTSIDGRFTTTVPRSVGAVTARYEPGNWWAQPPGYVGDTATGRTDPPILRYVRVLFEIAVPIGLLLLAAALVDRITGWRLWPPWSDL